MDQNPLLELNNFFNNYRDSFYFKLEKYPLPLNQLTKQFEEFCSQNLLIVSCFLKQEFQVENISDTDVKQVMQVEILDPIIDEMQEKIQQTIEQVYESFMYRIDIEIKFKLDIFLMMMYQRKNEIDEFFLNILINEKSTYFSEIKIPNASLLDRARIINDCLSDFYLLMIKLLEGIYQNYGLYDRFIRNLTNFQNKLNVLLGQYFKTKKKDVYDHVEMIINSSCEELLNQQEFEDNLQNITNFANYFNFSKEYKELKNKLIMESLKSSLQFNKQPCHFLVQQPYEKLHNATDKVIQTKIESLRNNYAKLSANMRPILSQKLDQILSSGIQIFGELNEQQLYSLFVIISCSNTFRNKEEFNIFQKWIEQFQLLYLSEDFQNDNLQKLREILKLDYNKFCQEQPFKHQLQEKQLKYWQEKVNQETNIYTILCLYLNLHNIQIDLQNKCFLSNTINPIQRYFLKVLMRQLQNGSHEYLNWQLITLLDSLIDEKQKNQIKNNFQSEEQQQQNNESNNNNNEQQSLLQYDILNYLRQKQPENGGNLLAFLQKQQQIDQELVLFPEFNIIKISPYEKTSKMIFLCIDGFTYDKKNLNEKWSKVIEMNPDAEVYSLQYINQTDQQKQFEIYQSYASLQTEYEKIYLRLSSMGFFLENTKKNNPYKNGYHNSIQAGKCLGYLLGKSKNLFPQCCVSIIGFSLGSLVIQSCLEYLESNKLQNILFEVLMIGGVAETDVIEKMEDIQSVARLINCYSLKDIILKYSFQLSKHNNKPIGLNQIKIKYAKCLNIDLTDQINSHFQYMLNLDEIIKKTDFGRDFLNFNDKY